ncbi:MAG: DMT family transporter, partial [Acidobacteriia bacterium]|nr:DMT family transporter [Terriglobia bacterium]
YGNWKVRACSFKSLLIPSLLVFAGLLFINAPALQGEKFSSGYLLGVLASFCALFAWTWYVVANSRFLKENPAVTSSLWSTLSGIGTFVWTVLFVAGAWVFSDVSVEKYTVLTPSILKFIGGSLVLGILCSWVAFFLWNRATLYLPVPLVGLLSTFEMSFGLLFIYLFQQKMPPWTEGVGAALFLMSIFYVIKKFSAAEARFQQD